MAANEPGQPAQSSLTWSNNLAVPAVALAIGAHPDDVEFGCGATLAKWAASGCVVHHLILTDGSKGTWNPDADTAALAAQRQIEQSAAAQLLSGGNAGQVIFLEQTDGELESSLEMRAKVALWIRRLRPDVILGHDPWKRYRIHPDHRHAGLLACEGIVAARDPHFFREQQLAPARPHTLLLWEADQPDHCEEISEFVESKIAALEAHQSQFESTMHATSESQIEDFRTRVRQRLAALGTECGIAAAEVFKRIDDL
jgi:LmbE family N-acetylglucosaminyl deacetylase